MAESDVKTDFKSMIKKKKVKTTVAPILLEPDLADALDETQRLLGRLYVGGSKAGASEELKKKIAELEKQAEKQKKELEEHTLYFRFRSIGRVGLDDMLSEHAPTKQQIAKAREQGETDLQYNPDTFPVALIAASSYEPEMTLEEVQEMWDSPDWNTNELVLLFMKAQEANNYLKELSPKKD